MQTFPPERLRDRYIRISLPLNHKPPKLDEVLSMPELQERTRSECARSRDKMRSVADRLIATCFYFELKPGTIVDYEDESTEVTGNILCRFPPGSEEISKLGEALRKRSTDAYNQQAADHDSYFVILERWKEDEAQKTVIGAPVVDKMMRDAQFSFSQVTLRLSKRIAETNIALCFTDRSSEPIFYPISGFPKHLLEEERKVHSRLRYSRSLGRKRTPTSGHNRDIWELPYFVGKMFDPLQRYRDPTYLNPGDASSDAISQSNSVLHLFWKQHHTICMYPATASLHSALWIRKCELRLKDPHCISLNRSHPT